MASYKNPYNFDNDIKPGLIDKSMIEDYAVHLYTKGAYVQTPTPGVYAILNDEVLIGVDAKSLYPTEMCNGNIGYDSLYGRIYDEDIVGSIINFIQMVYQQRTTNPKIILTSYSTFKKNIAAMVTDYTSRNSVSNKTELKAFCTDYYSVLFYKIVSYKGTLENIFQPQTDEEYALLKCALYPILECVTWISKANPGYNKTVINYIFDNLSFKNMYQNKKFYLFDKINSTYTKFYILNYEQTLEYYFTKFILNPYGTLFYKHHDFKSFEVDKIFRGMESRKKIKDEYLVLDAVTTMWSRLSKEEHESFYNSRGKLDDAIAEKIISIVGDSNEKTRQGQLKSLLGITFNIKETIDYRKELTGKDIHSLIYDFLNNLSNNKNSYQNGEKVNLNTGYGLNGMVSWDWSQVLIANSITAAGKIHGIKMFQQIASKMMQNERASRKL